MQVSQGSAATAVLPLTDSGTGELPLPFHQKTGLDCVPAGIVTVSESVAAKHTWLSSPSPRSNSRIRVERWLTGTFVVGSVAVLAPVATAPP